uniref:ATG C terminal domain-containing protein n=1 Tax=Neospora caninum (strain Liverpool) TaxID=572307 RepID=A0A0F7U8F4_NEOCL|nr:TPA: ATG C terminal domain-containing protein [Neospora caninum Liverpool]
MAFSGYSASHPLFEREVIESRRANDLSSGFPRDSHALSLDSAEGGEEEARLRFSEESRAANTECRVSIPRDPANLFNSASFASSDSPSPSASACSPNGGSSCQAVPPPGGSRSDRGGNSRPQLRRITENDVSFTPPSCHRVQFLSEPKVEQDTATPEAPPASLPTPTSSRPPLSLPSRILVFFSSFIKEALVSSLRRIVVGPFLKDLDEHQLHVALGKREVSVSHVQVQTAAANQLLLQTGIPVQLREVYIEQIQWLVPWRLRLKGVHVAIEVLSPNDQRNLLDKRSDSDDECLCPDCGGARNDPFLPPRYAHQEPASGRRGPAEEELRKGASTRTADKTGETHVDYETGGASAVASAIHETKGDPSSEKTQRTWSSTSSRGYPGAPVQNGGGPSVRRRSPSRDKHQPGHAHMRHRSEACDPHQNTTRRRVFSSSAARQPAEVANSGGQNEGAQASSFGLGGGTGLGEGGCTMDDILRMLRRAMHSAVGALDVSVEDITVSFFVPLPTLTARSETGSASAFPCSTPVLSTPSLPCRANALDGERPSGHPLSGDRVLLRPCAAGKTEHTIHVRNRRSCEEGSRNAAELTSAEREARRACGNHQCVRNYQRKGRKRERDCEENDVVRGWVLRFHVELIRVCEVDQEGSTVSVQIDGLSASLLSDAASLFSRRSRADDRQVSHRRAGSAPHRKDTTERSWRRYFRGHSSHPKEKREAAEHDEERQRCNGAALGDKKVTGASPKQGVSSLLESRSWDLSNEKPLDENRSSFYLVHRKWLDAPGDLLFVTKPPIPGRTPTRSASSSQDVKGSPTSLVSNYSLASEKAATHVCASDLHASPPPGASRQKTGSDFPRQANPLLEHFCPKPCAPIGGTAPRSASIGATFSDDPELSRSRWNRASGLVGASPEASDRLGAVCGVNVLTGTETRARGRPRVAVAGGFTEPCVRGAGLHRAGTDIDFAFRGHEVLRPREISLEAVCAEREDRGRIAGEADSKGVARFDASGVVGEKEDRNAPTSSDGEEDDDAVQEPSPYSICGVLQMRPSKRLHSPLVGISPVFSPFAATSPGQSRRASVSCASLATPVCACVAKALVSTSPSHSAFDGTQTGGSIALSPGAVPCGSPSPYTPALSAFSVPLAPPSHVPPGPADLPTQFLPSYGGEEVPVAPLAPARGAPSSPPSAHDQHPAVVAAVAAALDASHSSFVGEGGTRGRESLGEDAHFLRASGVSQSPFGARLSGSGVGRSPSAAEAAMQAAAVAGLEFAVRLRFPLFFTCVSMHQVHQLAQVLDRLSSLFQPSSAAFDPPESRSGLAAGEPSSPPSCTCAEKLPEMRRPLFPPGSEEEDERQKRQTTGEQADAGGADDDAPFEKVEPLETALNPRTSTEEKGVCGIARISRTGEEREEQGGPCGGRQALGEERRYGAGKDQGEDAPADVGAEASKDRKRIERAYEDERGPRGTVPGDDDPSQRAAPEQDAARTTEKSGGNSDAQRNAFHPTGRHATGVETERSDEGERVEARGAEDAAEGAAPAQTGGGRGGDHQESGTEGRANGGDRQSRSASLSPPSASLSPPSASLSPPSASLSPPSADPVEQGPEASPLGLEAGGEKHTSVWRRLVSYISSAARRGGRERAGDPSEGCEGSFGARTGTGGHKFRAGWRQKERHIAREGEQGALVSLLEGECRGREGDRAQAASVAPTHAFPPFSGSFGGEEVFASASAGTDIYGDDFVWSDALRFPQRRSLAAPSTFAHPRVFSSGDGDTSDAFAPSARSPPLGDGQDAWLPCRSQREPLSAARNGDPGDAGPRSSARETNQETGRARGEWRDTLDEDASPAVRSGATRPSGDGATASSHRQEEAGRGEACQGNPKKQGDARGGVSTVSSRDTPDTTAPPLPYAWVIHVEILQVYANLVLSQDFRASLLIRERKRLPESLGQLRSASGMGAVEDGRGSLPLFSFSSATESAHPTLRGVSNILSSLRGNRSSALSAGAANTEGGSKKTPLSPETCAGLSPAEWRDRLVDGCRPAWLSGCTLGAARKSPRCFSATASPACSLFRTVTRTTLGDGKKAKGAVQLLIPFPRASFVSFIASDFACTFVSSLPTCLVDAAAVAASAVVSEGGQHASSFSPPLCSSASAFPPWRPARRLPHGFPARPLHPPGSRQLPSSSSSFPSPAVPGGGVSRRRPPARNSFPGECGDSERALWVDRSAEPQGVRSVWPHPPSQRGTDEEWELSCDGRGTRGAAGNLPAVRETNRSFATSDLDHEAVNSASPGFRGSSGNHRVAAHAPTASGPYTTGWSNRTSSAACGRQGGPRSGFPLASSPFLASGSPAATGWHALVSTGQWAVEMHLLRHNWKTGLSPMGDEGISRGDSVEKCFRDDREPVRRKRMHAKRARKPRIASQEAMHRVTGSIAPASCEGRGDTREGRLCETEVGGRRTLDKRGREGQGLNENDDTRKATGASRSTAGASVEDTRGGRGRRGGAGEKGNDESTREAKDQARDTRWSLRATVAGKENANTSTNSVREETGERVEEESQQPAGPPTADAPAWESPRALQREDSEKQCEATEIKREGDGDASDSRDASKRPTADPEGDKRDDREQTADQHETATPHTSSSSSASSLSSSASSASCLSSCSSVTDPVAASGKTAEKRGRGGRRSRCRAAETRTRAQLAAEQAQETAGTVFLRGVGDVMPAGSKSEEEGKREEARESQRASVVPEDGSRQSGVSSSPCCSSAAAGQGSSVASSAQGSRGVAADLDRVIQSEKQPDAGAPLLNDGLDATEFRDCIEVEDGTERERTLLGLSACLRRSENNREGKSEDANGSRSPLGSAGGERERISRRGSALKSDSVGNGVNRRQLLLSQSHALRGDLRLPSLQNADEADGEGLFHISAGSDEGSPRGEDEADKTGQSAFGEESDGCASSVFASAAEADEGEEEERPPVGRVNLGGAARNAERSAAIENRERASRSRGQGVPFGDAWPASDDETDESVFDVLLLFFAAPVCARPPSELPSALSPFVASAGDGMHLTSRSVFHPFHPSSLPHSDSGSSSQSHAGSPSLWGASSPDSGTPAPFRPPFVTASSRIAGESQAGEERTHRMESELRVGVGEAECLECHCLRDSAHPRASAGKNRGEERGRTRAHPGAFGNSGSWPRPRAPLGQETRPNAVPPSADTSGASPFPFFALPAPRLPLVSCTSASSRTALPPTLTLLPLPVPSSQDSAFWATHALPPCDGGASGTCCYGVSPAASAFAAHAQGTRGSGGPTLQGGREEARVPSTRPSTPFAGSPPGRLGHPQGGRARDLLRPYPGRERPCEFGELERRNSAAVMDHTRPSRKDGRRVAGSLKSGSKRCAVACGPPMVFIAVSFFPSPSPPSSRLLVGGGKRSSCASDSFSSSPALVRDSSSVLSTSFPSEIGLDAQPHIFSRPSYSHHSTPLASASSSCSSSSDLFASEPRHMWRESEDRRKEGASRYAPCWGQTQWGAMSRARGRREPDRQGEAEAGFLWPTAGTREKRGRGEEILQREFSFPCAEDEDSQALVPYPSAPVMHVNIKLQATVGHLSLRVVTEILEAYEAFGSLQASALSSRRISEARRTLPASLSVSSPTPPGGPSRVDRPFPVADFHASLPARLPPVSSSLAPYRASLSPARLAPAARSPSSVSPASISPLSSLLRGSPAPPLRLHFHLSAPCLRIQFDVGSESPDLKPGPFPRPAAPETPAAPPVETCPAPASASKAERDRSHLPSPVLLWDVVALRIRVAPEFFALMRRRAARPFAPSSLSWPSQTTSGSDRSPCPCSGTETLGAAPARNEASSSTCSASPQRSVAPLGSCAPRSRASFASQASASESVLLDIHHLGRLYFLYPERTETLYSKPRLERAAGNTGCTPRSGSPQASSRSSSLELGQFAWRTQLLLSTCASSSASLSGSAFSMKVPWSSVSTGLARCEGQAFRRPPVSRRRSEALRSGQPPNSDPGVEVADRIFPAPPPLHATHVSAFPGRSAGRERERRRAVASLSEIPDDAARRGDSACGVRDSDSKAARDEASLRFSVDPLLWGPPSRLVLRLSQRAVLKREASNERQGPGRRSAACAAPPGAGNGASSTCAFGASEGGQTEERARGEGEREREGAKPMHAEGMHAEEEALSEIAASWSQSRVSGFWPADVRCDLLSERNLDGDNRHIPLPPVPPPPLPPPPHRLHSLSACPCCSSPRRLPRVERADVCGTPRRSSSRETEEGEKMDITSRWPDKRSRHTPQASLGLPVPCNTLATQASSARSSRASPYASSSAHPLSSSKPCFSCCHLPRGVLPRADASAREQACLPASLSSEGSGASLEDPWRGLLSPNRKREDRAKRERGERSAAAGCDSRSMRTAFAAQSLSWLDRNSLRTDKKVNAKKLRFPRGHRAADEWAVLSCDRLSSYSLFRQAPPKPAFSAGVPSSVAPAWAGASSSVQRDTQLFSPFFSRHGESQPESASTEGQEQPPGDRETWRDDEAIHEEELILTRQQGDDTLAARLNSKGPPSGTPRAASEGTAFPPSFSHARRRSSDRQAPRGTACFEGDLVEEETVEVGVFLPLLHAPLEVSSLLLLRRSFGLVDQFQAWRRATRGRHTSSRRNFYTDGDRRGHEGTEARAESRESRSEEGRREGGANGRFAGFEELRPRSRGGWREGAAGDSGDWGPKPSRKESKVERAEDARGDTRACAPFVRAADDVSGRRCSCERGPNRGASVSCDACVRPPPSRSSSCLLTWSAPGREPRKVLMNRFHLFVDAAVIECGINSSSSRMLMQHGSLGLSPAWGWPSVRSAAGSPSSRSFRQAPAWDRGQPRGVETSRETKAANDEETVETAETKSLQDDRAWETRLLESFSGTLHAARDRGDAGTPCFVPFLRLELGRLQVNLGLGKSAAPGDGRRPRLTGSGGERMTGNRSAKSQALKDAIRRFLLFLPSPSETVVSQSSASLRPQLPPGLMHVDAAVGSVALFGKGGVPFLYTWRAALYRAAASGSSTALAFQQRSSSLASAPSGHCGAHRGEAGHEPRQREGEKSAKAEEAKNAETEDKVESAEDYFVVYDRDQKESVPPEKSTFLTPIQKSVASLAAATRQSLLPSTREEEAPSTKSHLCPSSVSSLPLFAACGEERCSRAGGGGDAETKALREKATGWEDARGDEGTPCWDASAKRAPFVAAMAPCSSLAFSVQAEFCRERHIPHSLQPRPIEAREGPEREEADGPERGEESAEARAGRKAFGWRGGQGELGRMSASSEKQERTTFSFSPSDSSLRVRLRVSSRVPTTTVVTLRETDIALGWLVAVADARALDTVNFLLGSALLLSTIRSSQEGRALSPVETCRLPATVSGPDSPFASLGCKSERRRKPSREGASSSRRLSGDDRRAPLDAPERESSECGATGTAAESGLASRAAGQEKWIETSLLLPGGSAKEDAHMAADIKTDAGAFSPFSSSPVAFRWSPPHKPRATQVSVHLTRSLLVLPRPLGWAAFWRTQQGHARPLSALLARETACELPLSAERERRPQAARPSGASATPFHLRAQPWQSPRDESEEEREEADLPSGLAWLAVLEVDGVSATLLSQHARASLSRRDYEGTQEENEGGVGGRGRRRRRSEVADSRQRGEGDGGRVLRGRADQGKPLSFELSRETKALVSCASLLPGSSFETRASPGCLSSAATPFSAHALSLLGWRVQEAKLHIINEASQTALESAASPRSASSMCHSHQRQNEVMKLLSSIPSPSSLLPPRLFSPSRSRLSSRGSLPNGIEESEESEESEERGRGRGASHRRLSGSACTSASPAHASRFLPLHPALRHCRAEEERQLSLSLDRQDAGVFQTRSPLVVRASEVASILPACGLVCVARLSDVEGSCTSSPLPEETHVELHVNSGEEARETQDRASDETPNGRDRREGETKTVRMLGVYARIGFCRLTLAPDSLRCLLIIPVDLLLLHNAFRHMKEEMHNLMNLLCTLPTQAASLVSTSSASRFSASSLLPSLSSSSSWRSPDSSHWVGESYRVLTALLSQGARASSGFDLSAASYAFPLLLLLLRSRGMLRRENLKAKRISTWLGEDATSGRRQGGTERDESADATRVVESRASWENEGANERDGDWPSSLGYAIHARRTNDGDRKDAISDAIPRIPASCPLSAPSGALASRSGLASSAPGLETRKRFESEEAGIGLPCVEDFWARRIPSLSLRGHEGRSFPECGGLLADIQMDAFSAVPAASPSPFILPPSSSLAWPADPTVPQNRFREDSVCDSVSSGAFKARGASSSFDGEMFTADPRPRQTADDFHLVESLPSSSSRLASFSSSSVHVPAYPAAALPAFRLEEKEGEWRDTSSGRETDAGACGQRAALNRNAERGGILEDYIACPTAPSGEEEKPAPETAPGMHGRPGDGKGGARREGARQTSTGLDTKGLSGRAKKEREDRGEALETQRERGKPSFFVSLERTAQRLDEDHLPFPMTAEMRESEEKEEAARDELYATFFGPALADSETPPKALPSSEAPTSPADHPREGMALWRDSRHSQGFTFAPHFALGSSRHSSSPYAVSAGPETSPLLGGSSLSAASSAAAVCGGQPAGTQLHAAEKEDRTLVSLPGSPEAPPARACPSAGLSRFASSLFAAVPDSLACRHPGRPWAALLDGGRDSGPRQQGGRGTPASAGDWRSEQDAAEDGWRCGVHLHLGRMEINVSRGADFAVVSLRGHEGSGHSASSASRTRPETPKARDARTCGEQERVRGRNGRKRRSRSGGDAASKPSGGRSLGDAEPLAGRNRATGEIPFEACADDRGEQPSRPGRWKEEVAEIVLEAADFVFGGRAGNRENTPASRTRREKAQATHGPVTQRQMVQVAPDGEGRDDHAVETGQAKVTPGASSWGMSSFASSASFASSRSPSGVSLPSGLESPPPRGRRGHFTGKGFASSAAGACRRRVALRIHNFAVRDLVRGSLFSHFVRYYDDQKRPRLASVPMLALSIEEYCLSIQPPGATGACLRGDAPRGSERPARERQRASLNEERECGEKSRERERKPLEREKDKEAERRSGDRQPRSSAPVVRQATPRRDGRREMQKWGEDADTRNENAENEHEMCVQQREGLHRLEEALARPLRTREERESTVETPRNSGRGARHDGAGEGTCVIDPGRAALAPTRAQREPELRRSRTCSPLEYTVEIRLLPLSLTIQQESLDAFEDVNRQLRMAGFVECSQPLFSSSEEDGAGSGSDPDEGDSDDDRGHGDGPFLWGKEDGHLTSGGRRGANRSSEEGSSSLSPSSAPAVGSLRRTRRREQDSPVFCDIFGDRGFRRNAPASPCKVAAMVTSAPRLASCRRQENLRHGARFAEKESAPFAVSAHADAPSSRAHMTECTYTESCGFPTPDKNGLSALADGWRFPPVPAFLSSSLDPFQNNADESPFASSLDRSHPSALSFAASPYYPASPSVPAHPYEDLLPSPSAESAGLQHAFTVSLEGKFTEFLSQKTETHGHRAPDRSCVSSSSSAVSAGASPARGRKTSGVAWREEEAPDGNRLAGRRQRERGDRMGGTAEEGRNCFEDEEDFESVSFGESPFFIRSFDMPPLLLRIDYVPKRLDPTGVCNGQLNEVVNFLVSFCRVEGMEVTLARKAFRSVTSGEVLLEQLLASWADDFNRALVLKCMRGITPFRHVLRLGRRMKAVAQKLLRLSVHHWRTKDLTSKTFFYANYAQYRQFIRNSLLSAGGQEFPHFSWVALKQAAAIIVAASVEGITWSERVMRSAHCLLQILDRRCTPGLCPAYPSSTLRFAPRREDTDTEDDGLASRVLAFPETCERGRGRDLHQRDLQESGRRVAHRQSDASGSTSIRLTARDPSRATNLDEASGMGSSATGLEGERGNDWAVVRLGADGSYEPHTIVHGLSDGFCCVRRGIVSARHVAERLWSPPSSVLSSLAHGGLQDPERRREEQREGRGLVPAVVVGTECIQVLARLLPIFILRPMLGFTEGVTRTLQGTRNQLVPRLREERVAKLREPSYRVQRFTEDEEEGPTPL